MMESGIQGKTQMVDENSLVFPAKTTAEREKPVKIASESRESDDCFVKMRSLMRTFRSSNSSVHQDNNDQLTITKKANGLRQRMKKHTDWVWDTDKEIDFFEQKKKITIFPCLKRSFTNHDNIATKLMSKTEWFLQHGRSERLDKKLTVAILYSSRTKIYFGLENLSVVWGFCFLNAERKSICVPTTKLLMIF